MAEPTTPPGFDFTDPDRCVQRLPAEELAELRHTAPVWWSKQPRGTGGFDDEGYWVVTRHADVLEVSRRSDIYSSEAQTALIRYALPVTEESLQLSRLILLNRDPPGAHQAARHHVPGLRPAGHRQPAPGAHRPAPADRRHGRRGRDRRLRHRRGV